MSRFDYVEYDSVSVKKQMDFKEACTLIENGITALGGEFPEPARSAIVGRAKALALTKLEEMYMWIGKAIRDEQKQRNSLTKLQEERKNG